MKKYAICGVSNRAITMFIQPMLKNFTQQARLVALLDKDPKRFAVCKQDHPSTQGVPEYKEDEFERMVDETRPDVIIVAGRDDTHITYIEKALNRDLDVISEKPMTTNAADSRRVMEAEKKIEQRRNFKKSFHCPFVFSRKITTNCHIQKSILDGL